jgi:hypothetical protein
MKCVGLADVPSARPTAADDSALVGPTPAYIPVLRNDTHEGGQQLRITAVGRPSKGTAVINGKNIVYTANAGFRGTDQFSYSISDQNGAAATATVTVRSWDAVKGTHILPIDLPSEGLGFGRVALTVTGPGTYSASGVFGGRFGTFRTARSGTLDATGQLTIQIATSPGAMALTFFIGEGATGGIRATAPFGLEQVTQEFRTFRQVPAGAFAGRYTLVTSDPSSDGSWSVFHVRSNGAVTISGRLMPGFPFSSAGYVDTAGRFQYFSGNDALSITSGKVLSGQVALNSTAESDGQGVLNIGSDFTDIGFRAVETIASRYRAPLAKIPWFTYSGDGTVKVLFNRNLQTPLESVAQLGSLDRAVLTAPFGNLLFQRSESAEYSSGTFRGKVTLPGEAAARRFSGVVFQKTNRAVGFVNGNAGDWGVPMSITPQ